ncbi:hypothetical protein GDO81_020723 [Engystomops pustulosus]|uniref:Uncharacterized protein n=1 Tax=Engystomops pustulosus TaxID=76066 RepID=A0AAV6Z7I5_ENGPU|nr:hypothetical protein GDO81_020723 [Engystomops pustulosus]
MVSCYLCVSWGLPPLWAPGTPLWDTVCGPSLLSVTVYNKLLEKSVFLKDLTEKIQTEPILSPGVQHAAR